MWFQQFEVKGDKHGYKAKAQGHCWNAGTRWKDKRPMVFGVCKSLIAGSK